jgi:hypothetical protein
MDLEDVGLLTSDQGRHLLSRLPDYDPALAIKLLDGLRRRGVDPKLASAALTQSRLRTKARDKFGPFADQMIFTDQGLQQATRLEVAAHHAERYLASGARSVVDLTGGIGGDALAMAGLGLRVEVYERDAVTAAVAGANLSAFPEARVVTGDCFDRAFNSGEALFADPSRRLANGQRIFDPAAYDPPLGRLTSLAEDHAIGIKVAPGIPHRAIPAGAEAEWVSVDGAVVEAGFWFGLLRSPAAMAHSTGPHRAALVIRHGQAHHLAGSTEAGRLPVGPLLDFLYEPDGAVIRASLIAEAAATLGTASLIDSRIAYVTSAAATTGNPFLTGYRVLDSFPFNLKHLRSYLRLHGIGQVTVKKRGTAVDPSDLRKRLNLKGGKSATVILTRLDAQQSVIITEPLPTKESP